jgi:hypothetical protein
LPAGENIIIRAQIADDLVCRDAPWFPDFRERFDRVPFANLRIVKHDPP